MRRGRGEGGNQGAPVLLDEKKMPRGPRKIAKARPGEPVCGKFVLAGANISRVQGEVPVELIFTVCGREGREKLEVPHVYAA